LLGVHPVTASTAARHVKRRRGDWYFGLVGRAPRRRD
jgi:hypothetical protein